MVVTAIEPRVKGEVRMPRGRKPKALKPPPRWERVNKLRERIISLPTILAGDGFGELLKNPSAIQLIEPADHDPKTGGHIGKVKEPLGVYIQRVSVENNFSQRPPFDHLVDPIYRRLIRDFIAGAAMPEAKVAALSPGSRDQRADSLDVDDLRFSVIDGLQRLYCFCIAILLVRYREQLVDDGIVPQEAWDYFSENLNEWGDPRTATEKMLQRPIRYEVFFRIDLRGLLHYMVTFNTGQRRMSLPVQLEIMQRPLIEELQARGEIPIWYERGKTPGMGKPKDEFSAADLVLATQAFITYNVQVSASDEAERFLNEDQYLDDVGDIGDVVKTIRRIGTEIHKEVMKVYADDVNQRYILSGGGTFLLGLVAAAGYVRKDKGIVALDSALDKLMAEMKKPVEDPLKLDEYAKVLSSITSSRGKTIRRLVDDTFRRFFLGSTSELEWADTARQFGVGRD